MISCISQTTEVTSLKEAWDKYRKRVVIAVAVQTLTAASGINVISMFYTLLFPAILQTTNATDYYQTTLYENLGIAGHQVLLLAACYGTVGIVMNVISVNFASLSGR